MKISNEEVLTHTGLVHRQAAKWRWALNGTLAWEDLLQAGFQGITRSLELYDPAKGSFSNYAIKWVNHFMRRASEKSCRIVKVTLLASRKSANAGIVIPLTSISLCPMDYVPTTDSDSTGNNLEPVDTFAHTEPTQEESYFIKEQRQAVDNTLYVLNDRQRKAITLKFYESKSNEEIAVVLGLTSARVKQILASALEKIKEELSSDDE